MPIINTHRLGAQPEPSKQRPHTGILLPTVPPVHRLNGYNQSRREERASTSGIRTGLGGSGSRELNPHPSHKKPAASEYS